MESPTPEGHVKQVVLDRLPRCAVCHSPYDEDDINVVSSKRDVWMMVVECEVCHARNFVAAVLKDGDPDQAKVALQKMSEDVRNGMTPGVHESFAIEAPAPAGPPVSAGDVVDMHTFLNDFDGDFKRLFTSGSDVRG
ncbi:MAG TPA: multiheme c-type cytochrome [Thermomicrobiales bacterium]|jgi:hypothetical protein|nr:multiheme c-type cytochrome [Thermomicrobiales bacterium]